MKRTVVTGNERSCISAFQISFYSPATGSFRDKSSVEVSESFEREAGGRGWRRREGEEEKKKEEEEIKSLRFGKACRNNNPRQCAVSEVINRLRDDPVVHRKLFIARWLNRDHPPCLSLSYNLLYRDPWKERSVAARFSIVRLFSMMYIRNQTIRLFWKWPKSIFPQKTPSKYCLFIFKEVVINIFEIIKILYTEI